MQTVSVVIPVYRAEHAKGVSGCTAAKLILYTVGRFTNRDRKMTITLLVAALEIHGAATGHQCYNRGRL